MSPISPMLRPAALWFLFAWFLFLWGNWAHALWDRDEPRYCVATREMIQTGDWIIPHFNGQIRYDKPILIYWLMAAPMNIFGMNEFGARFTSATFGAIRPALLFIFAIRLGASLSGAHFAAAIGTFSVLLMVVSKGSIIDSTMITVIIGAVFLHWEQIRQGFSWMRHFAFWACLALLVLLKGPVGLMIVAFAALFERLYDALDQTPLRLKDLAARAFRRLPASGLGVVVFGIVALPWAILAWYATTPHGDFFQVAIGRHVVERAQKASNAHAGPFLYYIPVLLGGVFPFVPAVFPALGFAFTKRNTPAMRLLWAWLVPSLIVISAVKTKLPHYSAPLICAIALMMALWWTAREAGAASVTNRARLGGGGLMLLAGLAILLGIPIAGTTLNYPLGLAWLALGAALLAMPCLAVGALWLRGAFTQALVAGALTVTATVMVGFITVMPEIDRVRPSWQLGAWVRQHTPAGTHLMATGFQEGSFVFYSGGGVQMLGKNEWRQAITALGDPTKPAALLTTLARWEDWTKNAKGNVGGNVNILHQRRYFQWEQGKWIELLIVGNFTPTHGVSP